MVSVVSSLVVLGVGAALAVYIWKHRYIQKKRRGKYLFSHKFFAFWTSKINTTMNCPTNTIVNARRTMHIIHHGIYEWKFSNILSAALFDVSGSNDAEKLVKTLNDSSLNFKYSTLEKATGSFDNSNKLGQGGFGSVYKVTFSHSVNGQFEPIFKTREILPTIFFEHSLMGTLMKLWHMREKKSLEVHKRMYKRVFLALSFKLLTNSHHVSFQFHFRLFFNE